MKRLILILLLTLFSTVAYAQQGEGQICIRSFEDRNTNGTFDPNEPLITRGIGVDLMNSQSITIDSKLLEDSPTAAQGVVCFQQLVAGDYMVVVTSADYSAVTSTVFNASVIPGSVPSRFDFGGQMITTESISVTDGTTSATALTEEQQSNLLQGIFFGVIGAVIVMGVMLLVGIFIYFSVFRSRMNRILMQGTGQFRPITGPNPAIRTTTGSMQAVRPSTDSMPAVQGDTGEYSSVAPGQNPFAQGDLNQGSPPLFNEEDTDQMGSV